MIIMKQIINMKERNELLERKEMMEEALNILKADTTDDHYLMVSTSNIPYWECLNYGWYEFLTDEEVEALEVDKGENVWEVYEEYVVDVYSAKFLLEEMIEDLESELSAHQY